MYLSVCLARASKLTSLLYYCVTLLREGEITTCSSNKRRSSSPSTTIIIKREEITIQANERYPVSKTQTSAGYVRCYVFVQGDKRIREKQIQRESETVSNSNDNQVSFELENFNEVWNWKSNSHRPQNKRGDVALMTLCNNNS